MKSLFIAGFLCFLIACGFANPGRPSLGDSPEARLIFAAAERNRTEDGFLTPEELADIFHTFDLNVDDQVTEKEFLFIWKDRQLGDLSHASSLFRNADTDKNNVLTQVPDMARLFYYFDRDRSMFTQLSKAVLVVSAYIYLVRCATNQGTIADSAEARHIFHMADNNSDYQLDPIEFHQVFLTFDLNNDTRISADEFIQDWLSRSLGTPLEAATLFHHLDVDRSGYISEIPDLPFIIHFFDRDSDNHVSQAEFVIQWQKIQSS